MSDTKTANPYQLVVEGSASYPNVFKPDSFEEGGALKYSLAVIFDKKTDSKDIARSRAIIDLILKEKNKGKAIPSDKICLRDGSEKEGKEGYGDGVMFISTSSDRRPPVVDRNGRTPLQEDDDKIYAGARVKVCIRFWFQDNKYGKRINASLEAVQFVGDGERIGKAPVKAEDVFTSEEEDIG